MKNQIIKHRYKHFISILFLMAITTSCALVHSSFMKETSIIIEPKANLNAVEIFSHKPQRAAFRIGKISTKGNGFAKNDHLIKEAKEEAAKLGGDFILIENAGVDSRTIYSPGYSSYQSDASATYGARNGFSSSHSHGYSCGPSVTTIDRPWGIFSVWVYAPSQLGIRLEDVTISSFHLNSDAAKNGALIGDTLLGIDGYDIQDDGLIQHLMGVYPGDQVKLTLQRGSNTVECQITALNN